MIGIFVWLDKVSSATQSQQHCYNLYSLTLRPRQYGRHFADDICKLISLNENVWIPIKISLKFVPEGPINNIPLLVQIMAWCRPGDKPLYEPMMVSLPTHICVIRPQWVKANCLHQLRSTILHRGILYLNVINTGLSYSKRMYLSCVGYMHIHVPWRQPLSYNNSWCYEFLVLSGLSKTGRTIYKERKYLLVKGEG